MLRLHKVHLNPKTSERLTAGGGVRPYKACPPVTSSFVDVGSRVSRVSFPGDADVNPVRHNVTSGLGLRVEAFGGCVPLYLFVGHRRFPRKGHVRRGHG